jgi:hypothetical protein
LVAVHAFSGATGPTEVELSIVTVAAAPGTAVPIGAAVIGVALVLADMIWRGCRSSLPIERG